MATLTIKVGGTTLPGDVIALERGDELFWSEGTGRSATDGMMAGSVVAMKQTWKVAWGPITQAQYDAIRSAIGAGFLSLLIKVDSTTVTSCTIYRGAITGEMLGCFGGTIYWGNVTVELVEV